MENHRKDYATGISTFTHDTVVYFDRTEVNLKGLKYYIDGLWVAPYSRVVVIDPQDHEKLAKILGADLMAWALDGGDMVILGWEDFNFCDVNPLGREDSNFCDVNPLDQEEKLIADVDRTG
jgi:hypothetical protein